MPASSSAVPDRRTAHTMQPATVVTMLALLLGIQPITTDLYLPALPALSAGFGASLAQSQLTLSALLLAFGCAQLVLGPLSDRYGRRPVLLWGLGAYVVAAIACALAPSITWLIVGRTLQGAAMGASVMCARAVVRDMFEPAAGARVMSRALSGLGVIACLCAPLGGLVSTAFGWRAALLVLAIFGSATLALVALRYVETVPYKNPNALRASTLVRTWGQIVRNPTFVAFTLLTCCAYGLLFTFLAASSFVFIQIMGLGKTQYGFIMLWNSACYLAGTFLCRYWLPRHGVRGTVARGGILSLTGGTLMGVLALTGITSLWAIVLPLAPIMLGHGIHQPCGQSGAVGPFPQAAGAACALNGFGMVLVAFAIGAWLGSSMDDSVLPMTYGMWLCSACVALTAWSLVQKHGTPAHD